MAACVAVIRTLAYLDRGKGSLHTGIPQAECKLSTGAPYLTSSDPTFPPFPPHSDWSYASFELLTAKTSTRVSKVAQQKYLQVTGESGVQSVGPNA